MAGIMLPSLQKTTETKAHKSSAKNPHQGNNFAELVKAKSQSSTEARKNNQPARTALAEGPEQEKRSDRSPRNAANNTLVMVAPLVVNLHTPSPQVLGGRRSVVAATSDSSAHPKTSIATSMTQDAARKSAQRNAVADAGKSQNAQSAADAKFELPTLKSKMQNKPVVQTDVVADVRTSKLAVEKEVKNAVLPGSLVGPQVDVAHTRSTQLALKVQPASAPAPTHQVAGLIIHAAKDGLSKAEMVLHPEGLGTVQVNLSLDSSGVMQATVIADPSALQALSQDLDNLVQSLQSAGIQMGDLQLQARDQQHSSQDFSKTPGMQQIGITNQADGDLGLLPLDNLNLTALIQGGAKLDLFI